MTFAERPTKRRRTREPVLPPPRDPDAATVIPEEVAASMLDRANARILQSVGYTGATRVAQESLRSLAENYLIRIMGEISRCAHAQRRTRPTVVDFQQMLLRQRISINSLDDEMCRVPSTSPIFPLPPPPLSSQEKDFIENPDVVSDLLGIELDGSNDRRSYIPEHLPPFPSKHTYLATPVFTERPSEPRVIREIATQEAVFAENALRKILAAGAIGNKKKASAETHEVEEGVITSAPSTIKRKRRNEVWEQAFNAIKVAEEAEAKLQANGAAGQVLGKASTKGKDTLDTNVWLEVVVNSDSQYWRGNGLGRAVKGRPA